MFANNARRPLTFASAVGQCHDHSRTSTHPPTDAHQRVATDHVHMIIQKKSNSISQINQILTIMRRKSLHPSCRFWLYCPKKHTSTVINDNFSMKFTGFRTAMVNLEVGMTHVLWVNMKTTTSCRSCGTILWSSVDVPRTKNIRIRKAWCSMESSCWDSRLVLARGGGRIRSLNMNNRVRSLSSFTFSHFMRYR